MVNASRKGIPSTRAADRALSHMDEADVHVTDGAEVGSKLAIFDGHFSNKSCGTAFLAIVMSWTASVCDSTCKGKRGYERCDRDITFSESLVESILSRIVASRVTFELLSCMSLPGERAAN